VTAGIGIASVDGSRPRRSLRPVAGLERLLGSGRVEPVAGGLGPKLNIEPIITISCRGHDRPGVAGHRREARVGARAPLGDRCAHRHPGVRPGFSEDRQRNKRLPDVL